LENGFRLRTGRGWIVAEVELDEHQHDREAAGFVWQAQTSGLSGWGSIASKTEQNAKAGHEGLDRHYRVAWMAKGH
jgi:hypothetical protein